MWSGGLVGRSRDHRELGTEQMGDHRHAPADRVVTLYLPNSGRTCRIRRYKKRPTKRREAVGRVKGAEEAGAVTVWA